MIHDQARPSARADVKRGTASRMTLPAWNTRLRTSSRSLRCSPMNALSVTSVAIVAISPTANASDVARVARRQSCVAPEREPDPDQHDAGEQPCDARREHGGVQRRRPLVSRRAARHRLHDEVPDAEARDDPGERERRDQRRGDADVVRRVEPRGDDPVDVAEREVHARREHQVRAVACERRPRERSQALTHRRPQGRPWPRGRHAALQWQVAQAAQFQVCAAAPLQVAMRVGAELFGFAPVTSRHRPPTVRR